MKYTSYLRISNKILNDVPNVTAAVHRALGEMFIQNYRKSHVWINGFEVKFYDQDRDNFLKNLVTIVVTGNLVKAPRIAAKKQNDTIKRIKKYYEHKQLRSKPENPT